MTKHQVSIHQLFHENKGRVCHKWNHYLPVYDRFFHPYRHRPINILEIGVSHGGSLQIWQKYFHPDSHIIGVDIEPLCQKVEQGNIEIFTGSQADRKFLDRMMEELDFQFDIIIDDGSHLQEHVKETFNIMWPYLNNGGIYLVEDLHTAYWPDYGGGLRTGKTFIDDVKWMIDDINGHHIKKDGYPNKKTEQIKGMYITDSIVIIEKDHVEVPGHSVTGTIQIY